MSQELQKEISRVEGLLNIVDAQINKVLPLIGLARLSPSLADRVKTIYRKLIGYECKLFYRLRRLQLMKAQNDCALIEAERVKNHNLQLALEETKKQIKEQEELFRRQLQRFSTNNDDSDTQSLKDV